MIGIRAVSIQNSQACHILRALYRSVLCIKDHCFCRELHNGYPLMWEEMGSTVCL